MKRPVLLIAAALVLLWGMTPFWVPPFAHWMAAPAASGQQGQPPVTQATSNVSAHRDLAPSGQVGDMFGVVNSLFSGLALIGVVYSLLIQLEHKRREKQPEVFARLASNSNEDQLVLAPMTSTPQGAVHLTLEVPIYIMTGASAVAFNVTVSAKIGKAGTEQTLPMPVLSASNPTTNDPTRLRVQIPASDLVGSASSWKLDKEGEFELGAMAVTVVFENHQRAKWEVVAEYAVKARSVADARLLHGWINNATAAGGGAKQIHLISSVKSWTPKEL